MNLVLEPDQWLIEQLKTIQSKLARIYDEIQGLNEEEKEFIHKQAFISNIGASTRIENALLTDQEVEWIDTTLNEDAKPTAFEKYKEMIFNKLSKDKERSIEEVAGCREMLEIVYSQYPEFRPLRETDLRGLHHNLLKHYPKADHYCGKYKPNTNRVVMINHETGEKKIVLDPASPGPITETAMRELVDWYNSNVNECPWPLLIASEFTFRFLAIHPFQDGNGRISRALFLLILLQSNDKYISEVAKYIAIDRHIEKDRAAYYLALRRCSDGKFWQDPTKYNLEPITSFFVRSFDKSLKDLEIYKEKFNKLQSLTDNDQLVLRSFKVSPEKRLRVSDIEKENGLGKRSIQKSITRLKEKGFLRKRGSGPQTVYQLIF